MNIMILNNRRRSTLLDNEYTRSLRKWTHGE